MTYSFFQSNLRKIEIQKKKKNIYRNTGIPTYMSILYKTNTNLSWYSQQSQHNKISVFSISIPIDKLSILVNSYIKKTIIKLDIFLRINSESVSHYLLNYLQVLSYIFSLFFI